MPLGISAPAQYAVRVLAHLAALGASESRRIREIADAEGIPYPFLAKLVGELVKAGFLDSFRGPTGGVRLARPPHKINVLEVVRAVDGPEAMEGCFLGLPACSDARPCPLHEHWKPMKQRLVSRLSTATVAELAETLSRRRS